MRFCLISSEMEHLTACSFAVGNFHVSDLLFHEQAQLPFSTFDRVLLAGFFPGVITRDFTLDRQIPKRDIPDAVKYKFTQNLPVDSEEVAWQYRIYGETGTEYRIRATAIGKAELAKLLRELAGKEIKLDMILLLPLILTEDIFPGIDDMGAPTEQNFKAFSTRSPVPAFLEKAKIDSIVSCAGMVPENMRPVRYRALKRINRTVAALAVIAAAFVIFSHWDRSYAEWKRIENENRQLTAELRELQRRNLKLNGDEKLLNSYREANAGYPQLELLLQELTQKVPDYMWVKSFRLSGNAADLVLESAKDDINFYNTMKDGKFYELRNLRKNKSKEDRVDYTLTLGLK